MKWSREYAQAQASAGGAPNQAAFDALYTIRGRAGLPAFTETSLAAFPKVVWEESYFELFYEKRSGLIC